MSNPAIEKWKLYLRTLPARIIFALVVLVIAYGVNYYTGQGVPEAPAKTAAEEPKPGATGGLGEAYADDTAKAIKTTDELNSK